MNWTLVIVLGVVGLGAGRGGRWLLDCSTPPAPVPIGACELGTALLWAAAAFGALAGHHPGWWLPLVVVLIFFAVPLALADLWHGRLPDRLTLSAAPALLLTLGIATLVEPAPGILLRAGCAGAVFGAAHALVRLVAPEGLGAGDVKLSFGLGATLGTIGWLALPLAACLAALCSALLAAAMALRRHGGRRAGVPHGPGMLVATLCVIWL